MYPKLTAKEAKEKTIYALNINYSYYDRREVYSNGKEFIRRVSKIEDVDVVTENLFDFIWASVEETTSPRGVAPKLHIRVNGVCNTVCGDYQNEEDCCIEVWTWGVGGNNPHFIQEFQTISEAEDFLFEKCYDYDFQNECNRSTFYTEDFEEAQKEASEIMEIPLDTYISYSKHKELANQIKAEREEKARVEREKQQEALKLKIRDEANQITVDEEFKNNVKSVYDNLLQGENKSKDLSVAFNALLKRNNIDKITSDYWQVFRIVNSKI